MQYQKKEQTVCFLLNKTKLF